MSCLHFSLRAMTVDSYMDNLLPDQFKLLAKVRKAIKEACPRADEIFSYNIPGYKYLGRPLIYFSAYKKHCSIFGMSRKILTDNKTDLSKFRIVGSTIHFTPDNPPGVTLVKRLVRSRMKEIEVKSVKKKK